METGGRLGATVAALLAITGGMSFGGAIGTDAVCDPADMTRQGWCAPPPEFADFTDLMGVERAYVQQWDPSLGEATSLLDVLPAGSPAVGDYNRDGSPDLFVPFPGYSDDDIHEVRHPIGRMFMNDWAEGQAERVVEITDLSGIDVDGHAYSATWGDVDGDGFVDLFVGGYRLAMLFRNEAGLGTFEDVTAASGLAPDGFVLGSAWGDYDADGDLDLFLAHFAEYEDGADGVPEDDFSDLAGRANELWRNNGDGTFTDVSDAAGISAFARRSTSASFVDADGDALVDVYVTNFGEPAELWHNTGDGMFMEMAAMAGLGDGAGATCQVWEDLDRDGDLDLYVAHETGVRDGLWLGDGVGTFSDGSAVAGMDATDAGRGWGCVPLDHDGDGDVDIFVAQSPLSGDLAAASLLLTNQLDEGAGLSFVDTTDAAGDHLPAAYPELDTIRTPRATAGVAAFDFNVDGQGPDGSMDLVTSTRDADTLHFFRYIGNKGGWGGGNGNQLRVILDGTTSNSLGIGAKVTVTGGTYSMTRQVGAGSTWGGQLPSGELFFGMAKPSWYGYALSSPSVTVRIEWPSGLVEEYPDAFALGLGEGARFTEGGGFRADFAAPRPLFTVQGETVVGENGWFTSEEVRLRLLAVDLAQGGSDIGVTSRVQYSFDAETWTDVACSTASCFKTLGPILTFNGDGVHPLWVRTTDKAGSTAVFLYPIRIDTTPPEAGIVAPVHGSAYVQGREVLALGDASPLARAIVAMPVVFKPTTLAPELQPVEDLMGSDGMQPVVAEPIEDGSGVARVDIVVKRASGEPIEGMSRSLVVPPFEYAWPAASLPQGTYRVDVTVEDVAGHRTTARTDVLLLAPPAPPEPEPPALGPRSGPPTVLDTSFATTSMGRR